MCTRHELLNVIYKNKSQGKVASTLRGTEGPCSPLGVPAQAEREGQGGRDRCPPSRDVATGRLHITVPARLRLQSGPVGMRREHVAGKRVAHPGPAGAFRGKPVPVPSRTAVVRVGRTRGR